MTTDVGVELHGPVADLILSDNLISNAGQEVVGFNGGVTAGLHGRAIVATTVVTPKFELPLMIHEDENGQKLVQELRLPPVPVRQSTGRYDFTHTDPLTKVVFAQDDWSGGGFQAIHNPDHPNKYAKANGVDARWQGMLVPGPRLDHGHGDVTEEPVTSVGFLVRDPSFENSTLSTAWNDRGTPTSTDSLAIDPRSGDNSARHVRVDAASSGDGVEQSLNNAFVYQGIEIVFHGYIKKVSGTGGVRIKIEDSAGSTAGTTITDNSYTQVSVTHTVDASASWLKVIVEATGDCTFDADDLALIPTGGVTCAGTTVYNDELYGIFGRFVCKYNGQNGYDGPQWDAVYAHASAAATDITTFNSDVYVAYGLSAAYIYGSSTSWSVATLSGDSKYAVHWTVSRSTLWKSETVNTIRSSTNPKNAGSWSSPYTVGSPDRQINNLYSHADTVVCGKEDGIWWYRRTYGGGETADEFVNRTNEFDGFLSTDNFAKGQDFNGWLWVIASTQSVMRIAPDLQAIQNVTDIVSSPAIAELSGRIRALTRDATNLWLAGENGLSGANARVTLMSVREVKEGFLSHPMEEVLMDGVDHMTAGYVNRGAEGTVPMLMMIGKSAGGISGSQKTYSWYIPEDSQSPIQATSPKTNLREVWIDSPVYHGGTPQEELALVSATIWTDGHENENVELQFGADGQPANSISAFTFSGGDGVETKYFENVANPVVNANGRSFEFRTILKPDTVNNVHTRKIKGLIIEMTLRPDRIRAWRCWFQVGGAIFRNGARQDDVIDKKTIITRLNELENQAYPLVLNQDFAQDGENEQLRVIIRPGTLRQTYEYNNTPEGMDIWECVLQHVPTT